MNTINTYIYTERDVHGGNHLLSPNLSKIVVVKVCRRQLELPS